MWLSLIIKKFTKKSLKIWIAIIEFIKVYFHGKVLDDKKKTENMFFFILRIMHASFNWVFLNKHVSNPKRHCGLPWLANQSNLMLTKNIHTYFKIKFKYSRTMSDGCGYIFWQMCQFYISMWYDMRVSSIVKSN